MAINSALNLQNIIGNRQGTVEQFQNFMTGGNSSLGSSAVNFTSANKIVPFERAGVKPVTPDFNSIISNISSKVDAKSDENLKNQENKVKSIINNIQNTFQTTLQNFAKGYQEKIKTIEDSKPSGLLEKFFGLYNNVTGFIQFFGDRKNLNKISNSLKGLRGLFEDSFETAKLIRKTINKIVKQLSSLPVATPSGGGGFNLDIKVPGGPLKNVAGGGRGRMLALGAGALGTGMLAGGAINALSGSENIQPATVQQSIPENLADSLSSIIDRFTNAVNSLIKTASEKPKSTPRTSGGGGGAPASPNPSPKNNINPTMGAFSQGATEKGAEIAQRLQKDLGLKDYQAAGIVGNLLNESSQLNPSQLQNGGSGLLTRAMEKGSGYGWVQWTDPGRQKKLFDYAKSRGIDPTKQKLTDEINYGFLVKELSTDYEGVLKDLKSSKNIKEASDTILKGYERPADQGPREQKERVEAGEQVLKKIKIVGSPAQKAQVAPAPSQTQANQTRASVISQPVKPQQPKITTISMPPQVSSAGGQSQGGGGGGGVSAPPPSGGGPSVPFLPAGNPNNFLVLYSKMVYNIVDA